jgi:hypothetical protein
MILAVDPQSLKTTVIPTSSVDFFQFVLREQWVNTPYYRSLIKHTSSPCPLQNDGLTQADTPVAGTFLTVDLCPSHKPLDKRLFGGLFALWQDRTDPAPVGIAITGAWLDRHDDDLRWLLEKVREKKLAVTWINHSQTHPYDSTKPLDKTFLLTPGTDFKQEVLATEIMLLEQGLLPSVFFRFPGLVSNCNLMKQLEKLSLIPVGSRAWLAKGERPTVGSIMLVHGNGNEPKGIDILLDLFKDRKDAFTQGKLTLLPLNEAVTGP